jgi:Clp amino terminal domain, pathogenicity island component
MGSSVDLERLAKTVETRSRGGSAIDHLQLAAVTARELRDVGDQLLDRYVQAARADDHSWAEIGVALGVSKQAAQQRFPASSAEPPAWPPNFSGRARGIMAAAQHEARELRHQYLGTEHVLLALSQDDGLAGTALTQLQATPAVVRQRIQEIIGLGQTSAAGELGVTPRTKRTLETARKEARRLGHRCANSEHLLLALSRQRDGVAVEILRDLGLGERDVRDKLADLLATEAPEIAAKLRRPASRRLGRR